MKRVGMISAVVVTCAPLLGGCGVTLTAKPAGADQEQMKEPGIYYSLPRTQIHVTIPVTLEVLAAGRVGAVYDDCLKACKAGQTTEISDKCALPTTSKLRVLRPELVFRGVPDPKHTYYVNIDTDSFATVKHKMTFSDNGIITGADSSGSSVAYEVVAGIVKAGAQLVENLGAASMMSIMSTTKRPKPLPPKPPAELADDATRLPCANALAIEAGLKQFKDAVKREQDRLDQFLAKPAKADYAKLVIERTRERIAAIEADALKYRVAADLEEVKKTFAYKLAAAAPIEPGDFAEIKNHALEFKEEAPVDAVQAKMPDIKGILKETELAFFADLVPQSNVTRCPPLGNTSCAVAEPAGYRYRIPRAGVLTVRSVKGTTNPERHDLLVDTVAVAQYGPVAALPGRFEGKGGSVELSISGVTGALTSVSIGAEGLPASAVLEPIESVRSAIEARREQKEKKADAAAKAAADSEKNDLERERDLLKLRKEIKELKDALGN